MNPVGISVFYGAFSENVAVAEVRPPVGAVVAVGSFSLLRTVRLLDFSFFPFAYHQESIFSPLYDRLRNKVGFLEKLHRRLSRPVLPSDEALEYLPTQAVAAYVANVIGLDGIIYGSTQVGAERDSAQQVSRSLCNIALFGQAARVERAHRTPIPPDQPVPQVFVRDLSGTSNAAEAIPVLMVPSDVETALPATLRVTAQPRLVKITSVTVETTSLHAHHGSDGSVTIHDYDDDDE